MSEQRQKIYSTEFKESSVKLVIESSQPIAHTARELGINPNTLYDVSTVFRTNNHAVFWSTLVSVNASNSAGDK